jgi:hypothetical protein
MQFIDALGCHFCSYFVRKKRKKATQRWLSYYFDLFGGLGMTIGSLERGSWDVKGFTSLALDAARNPPI